MGFKPSEVEVAFLSRSEQLFDEVSTLLLATYMAECGERDAFKPIRLIDVVTFGMTVFAVEDVDDDDTATIWLQTNWIEVAGNLVHANVFKRYPEDLPVKSDYELMFTDHFLGKLEEYHRQ